LSDLAGPIRSIKTPASIAIRINEVSNPPPRKGDSTEGAKQGDIKYSQHNSLRQQNLKAGAPES